MMVWNIEFTKEAQKDIRKLREPSKSHVNEAINKVAQNPLPSRKAATANHWGTSATATSPDT